MIVGMTRCAKTYYSNTEGDGGIEEDKGQFVASRPYSEPVRRRRLRTICPILKGHPGGFRSR
jgi:hypothetical protein